MFLLWETQHERSARVILLGDLGMHAREVSGFLHGHMGVSEN